MHPPGRRPPDRAASLLVALAAGLTLGAAPADKGPLEAAGSRPAAPRAEQLVDRICGGEDPAPICRCADPNVETRADRSPTVTRIIPGAFTGTDTPQRLAHLTHCGRTATALLTRADDDTGADSVPWRLQEVYDDLHTATCRRLDLVDRPDLLVCHRTVENETWRIGLFHALDLSDGSLERRQLTSYRSNARGCPADILRTEHPIGWRIWHVADDPRPPLVTIHFKHRNAAVPDAYQDACRAMEDGDALFANERRIAEYFELRDGRLQFAGATLQSGSDGSGANWTTDRRVEAPICRTRTVLERVRGQSDALRRCYAGAVDGSEAPSGTLELRWTIERSGEVADTEVVSDGPSHPALTDCVRRLVEQMSFVPPRAGDSCTFVYPFEFSTDQ